MKYKCGRYLVLFCFSALAVATDPQDVASFKKVWTLINDNHWDLAGTGVDWDTMYQKNLPKVEAAQSRDEVNQIIHDMIEALGQSHFGLMAAQDHEALSELASDFPGGNFSPGLVLKVIGDQIFVAEVIDQTPAASAGLSLGTEIVEAQGHSGVEIAKSLRAAFAASPHRAFYVNANLNRFFSGYRDFAFRLKIRQDDQVRSIELLCAEVPGVKKNLLNAGSVVLRSQSKTLDGNIGYISFSGFFFTIKEFRDLWLTPLMDTNGLILDLRNNPGGFGFLATGVAGHLTDQKDIKLGAMNRSGGQHLNFFVSPQVPNYGKPVAVLIDESSASTSEILAAGLQELGRARLFGVTTAGAALPSLIETLPNGEKFQYAIADFVTLKGRTLEGVGVVPDVEAPHTPQSMQEGRDAALEAAIAWLKTEKM